MAICASPVPTVANAPVVAERFMSFGNDITAGPGVSQPSRVWYFAEGSTNGTDKTYLLLFNPQSVDASATITYMQNDGRTAEQLVKIAAEVDQHWCRGNRTPKNG